jgi:histidine triad (HIT) family protein
MTVFTKIIERQLPSYILYEDDLIIAILAREGIHPGHTLIIPKIEVDYFLDVPEPYFTRIFEISKPLSKAIHKATACKRMGTMMLGWDVPHTHYHLIPMFSTGDLDIGKMHLISEDDQKQIQTKILGALSSELDL